MWTIRSLLLLVAVGTLPACAPTVWEKPGTTPIEFSADAAQCARIAEDANREEDVNPIAVGELKSIAGRVAAGHAHEGCMESKGYVASASGAPRGSRTRTYRSFETASLAATTDIEYYGGTSDGDLLRFQRSDPMLALNQRRLDTSHARAGAAKTPSTGVDLLADIGARWRRFASTFNF